MIRRMDELGFSFVVFEPAPAGVPEDVAVTGFDGFEFA
jgi:hypothetical protein